MSSQRPRAERLPKSKLDWSLVDAGLSAVPEAYLDERFYPLKHVVEVFSAKDPEAVTLDVSQHQTHGILIFTFLSILTPSLFTHL